MDIEKTVRSLKGRGFEVSRFASKEEATAYLVSNIKDTTVGIGGSKTAEQMGLYDALCGAGNEVFWHWKTPGWETLENENASKVFISSANAIAETGEIINIDGRGNRLAGQVFGKKTVYIISGTNKICPDFTSAVERAKNVAAPLNSQRFPAEPPCKKGGKCYDCRSADRICRAMLVLMAPMMDMEKVEVVLIDEELGF